MIKRLLCWSGNHSWESIGPFIFCCRPACCRVEYYTGSGYWDLDICDTRWVDETLEVQ